MPMSQEFEGRLLPVLRQAVEHFGSPFIVYDEMGIVEGGEALKRAFAGAPGFREYFAVKAAPNSDILLKMHNLDFGFDCSSWPELTLARQAGATPEMIMFTSNDTSQAEFVAVADGGDCILNLDDTGLIPKVPEPFPEMVCFRYNPGSRRTGNSIIGNPETAKYGVPHEQIIDAYRVAIARGAKRFGLHTMIISNELDHNYMVETVRMLLEVIKMISDELGIQFEFINMGGGLGIPYKPDDIAIPINTLGREIAAVLYKFKVEQGYAPKLFMESGRWILGPHGVLVATCINMKRGYRIFAGLDTSCVSSMMRPAMYQPEGGYHHISVPGSQDRQPELLSVVGPACEDSDRFGTDRMLAIQEGDQVLIHDAGAHCYAMHNNYNGRLGPQVLMLTRDGNLELIRRAETEEDLFATLRFQPNVLRLGRGA